MYLPLSPKGLQQIFDLVPLLHRIQHIWQLGHQKLIQITSGGFLVFAQVLQNELLVVVVIQATSANVVPLLARPLRHLGRDKEIRRTPLDQLQSLQFLDGLRRDDAPLLNTVQQQRCSSSAA